jgi:methyl-accepting chemotaxis protein
MIDGQNVLMTSIVFPLMVNGKLIASLSVDINLNSLQAISQGQPKALRRPDPGQHLSPTGLLAGYSPDASKLSQRLDRRHRQRRRAARSSPAAHPQPAQPAAVEGAVAVPADPRRQALGRVARCAGKGAGGPAEALKQQLDASNTPAP